MCGIGKIYIVNSFRFKEIFSYYLIFSNMLEIKILFVILSDLFFFVNNMGINIILVDI